MNEKKQEYGAVNIVAVSPEGILLIKDIKHKNPKLKFPGGHVEKGETHAFAAMRELKEETGLIAHIDDKNKIETREYPTYSKTIYLVSFQTPFENLHVISSEWEIVRVFSPEEIRFMGVEHIIPEHYEQLKVLNII